MLGAKGPKIEFPKIASDVFFPVCIVFLVPTVDAFIAVIPRPVISVLNRIAPGKGDSAITHVWTMTKTSN